MAPQQRRDPRRRRNRGIAGRRVPGRLNPTHQLLVINPTKLTAQQQPLGAQR